MFIINSKHLPCQQDFLAYHLKRCKTDEFINIALLLFDTLLRVRLEPESYFSAEIKLFGTDHWLNDTWEDVFKPKDVTTELYQDLKHLLEKLVRYGRTDASEMIRALNNYK